MYADRSETSRTSEFESVSVTVGDAHQAMCELEAGQEVWQDARGAEESRRGGDVVGIDVRDGGLVRLDQALEPTG